MNNRVFNVLTNVIIIANSGTMASNPTPPDQEPPPFFKWSERVFVYFYILEMLIKIAGSGFYFGGDDTYLKDSWNILDFIIVCFSFIGIYEDFASGSGSVQVYDIDTKSSLSLTSLRVVRVLRPLKTIQSIKGLKVLVSSVLAAIPLLRDTLLILVFFYICFAIAGLQLFTGKLKNRCFQQETGKLFESEEPYLCDGNAACPGGYFCARGDVNVNSDVTGFDNVAFSLLVVFQCVTLEGWSTVQKEVISTYHFIVYMYFLPLIFIGAFFLLNLTLAVINSQFTIAHKKQEALDALLEKRKKLGAQNDSDELEHALASKNEMSIAQFITARIYAKKMIEFLRRRQQANRDQLARIEQDKRQCEKNLQAKRNLQSVSLSPNGDFRENKSFMGYGSNKQSQNGNLNGYGNGVIPEEENEHFEDQDDHWPGNSTKRTSNKINSPKGLKNGIHQKSNSQLTGGGPKMKGNIGLQIKNIDQSNTQLKAFSKLVEELDLDNIIPKEQQDKDHKVNLRDTLASFDLSIQNLEIDSNIWKSEKEKQNAIVSNAPPGVKKDVDEASKGLITSDSDFEDAQKEAGYVGIMLPQQLSSARKQLSNRKRSSNEVAKPDFRKDVSKTFKQMLTINHSRTNLNVPESRLRGASALTNYKNTDQTIYAGSINELENELSEIEIKFQKKKNTAMKLRLQNKAYKEDEENGLSVFGGVLDKEGNAVEPDQGQNKKKEIGQVEEQVNTKRPKDSFKDLDPLVDKIEINPDIHYQGTSLHDVFQERLFLKERMDPVQENGFLKLPEELAEAEDPDYVDNGFVRSEFRPFQQKTVYEIKEDSTDPDTDSSDEAVLYLKEQPYLTASNIAYKEYLKQVAIEELARRSDIMITSTLSVSVFPKDKRNISQQYRLALMSRQELTEYTDHKTAFNAMVREHQYASKTLRDKDKEFRDQYLRSFIHKSEFQSKTMKLFKASARSLNSNVREKPAREKAVLRAERLKHEQNKRASQKRGLPKFTLLDAKMLVDGKYHEEDEEEDEVKRPDEAPHVFAQSYVDIEHQKRVQQFEMQLKKIVEEDESDEENYENEIPQELKEKLNLRNDMDVYEINFNQLRRIDISMKKQTPFWSGQDVLPEQMDFQKSSWTVNQLNLIRVWPAGMKGITKRIRYVLRIIVKHDLFDSLMTFMVVLNTVTLAADHYPMNVSLSEQLGVFNYVFTYTFIAELVLKLLALGVNKYCSEPMNWLDGTVVLISLLEETLSTYIPFFANLGIENEEDKRSADNSFRQVQALRLLRTFRVFRIARILRSLESMKMIISVMQNSWKSFIYITMLMFMMVVIFTLLGLSWFLYKFGNTTEDYTYPRSNFDTFSVGFATVFQVLTLENWQYVLYDGMLNQKIELWLISFYLVVWIMIGNWILLNLFLAILLDSFLEEDEDAEAEADALEQIRIRAAKRKAKKTKAEASKFYVSHTFNQTTNKKQIPHFLVKKEDEHEELEELDEDQIVSIFKEEGIIKKTVDEIRAKPLFVGVECNQSVYIFSKESTLRKFCYRLQIHGSWEQFILVLIVVSSLKLAFDSFTTELGLKGQELIDYKYKLNTADRFFIYAFLLEMIVKMIAKGVVMDSGSYLRDSWNQLDFFIVCTSLIEEATNIIDLERAVQEEGLGFMKILRILRVLRPLRFISHNVAMKLIVAALLESVGHIVNVLFVVGMIFLIFAIVGVSFFKGRLFRCTIAKYDLHTEDTCLYAGGQWKGWDHNFDDVGTGMQTLFVVSSLEGWPDIMHQSLDMSAPINSVPQGPSRDNTQFPILYFVSFIMFGSFFFLNFFIGVLFLKFNQAQAAENQGFTKEDLDWRDIQKLILKAVPDYETTNVPRAAWRRKFHAFVTHSNFESFIMFVILLNMVVMGMNFDNSSEEYNLLLKYTNLCFSGIFFCEAVLKLIAFGRSYFENSWNQFDFFVVVTSTFDVALFFLQSSNMQAIAQAPQLARVLRVLRVTRIVRLAGKAKNLQTIIQTIQFAVHPLMNVFYLLMIMFFMFAVLCNNLFKNITTGTIIDGDYKNFKNTATSFLLMFAISTGEDWNVIMYDTMRTEEDDQCVPGLDCGAPANWIIFFMAVLVCTHVMLNLFVLVIIKQFETYYLPKDNNITKFNDDKANFMKCWAEFTLERYSCRKIKENGLTKFFRKLGEHGDKDTSLGFAELDYADGELKKQLLKMAIKSDDGYIYFNELLYRCMRRRYGNMKINKQMQVIELRTQYLIYMMTLDAQKKSKALTNEDIFNSIIKKENGVNPFLTVMNFKITFKTWLKFARKQLRQIEKNKRLSDGANLNDTTTTWVDDEKAALHSVDIEVEQVYSETDEEDVIRDGIRDLYQAKLAKIAQMHGKQANKGSNSNQGSSRGFNSPRDPSKSSQKKSDHLKLFERKMTQKLKEQLKQEKSPTSPLGKKKSLVAAAMKKAAGTKSPPLTPMENLKKLEEDKVGSNKVKSTPLKQAKSALGQKEKKSDFGSLL